MNRPPEEHEEPGFVRASSSNPYQRQQEAAESPDLDANAPYLNSAEAQRLNRKALLFLGGLVILLLLAAFMIFGSVMSDGDSSAQAPRPQQQLVIPDAPALPELPPEQPMVALQEPMLPPLPVIDDEPARPSSSMPSMPSMPGSEPMSLMERRMRDTAGIFGGAGAGAGSGAGGGMMSPSEYASLMESAGAQQSGGLAPTTVAGGRRSSAQPLYNPNTLLLRGTYIRCVLEARIITDVPGFTSCVITEPVYSVNGKRLLLPRGSKVMGSYGADAIVGERAAIVWDRVTTPNGLDVNMRSPGVDMLGSAGNQGHYTAHWGQRVSSALLISLLSDAFKYVGAEHGPQSATLEGGVVVQNPYESNTARTLERMANMALERNMARPPTVTINQGTIINVYVAQDVDFGAVLR